MYSHSSAVLLACAGLLASLADSRPTWWPSPPFGSPPSGWGYGPWPEWPPSAIAIHDVNAAYGALQQFYNESIGLWIPSTGWWNSANCLTTIADLVAVDGFVKAQAVDVFANTYQKAPLYDLQMTKTAGDASNGWLSQSNYGSQWSTANSQTSGFLDGFYDDEGWWALAWIAAYDVTDNAEYLSQAELIFDDMYQTFGKTPCSKNAAGTGGIWWDKAHTYVNAIANELFLDVAARLANRVESKTSYYSGIAQQQLTWFKGSGMINSQNTINDGLDNTTCNNNGGTVWSYNQGVILGGLISLSELTKDASYIAQAQIIANAAIANLSSNGILHDPCEPDCGADGSQFKGVFTRNLGYLQQASPQATYATFLQNNANSIWTKDRNSQNQLSVVWSGPFVSPANASTQSSAMDTLVAALAL